MLPPSWPSCFTVGMVFKLYQYSRSFPVILSKALKVLTHSYSTFNNKLMLYLLRALIAVLCLSFRLYIMFGIHIFPIFYFNLFVKSLKKWAALLSVYLLIIDFGQMLPVLPLLYEQTRCWIGKTWVILSSSLPASCDCIYWLLMSGYANKKDTLGMLNPFNRVEGVFLFFHVNLQLYSFWFFNQPTLNTKHTSNMLL